MNDTQKPVASTTAGQQDEIVVREATAPNEPDSAFEAALMSQYTHAEIEYALASAAERARKEITRMADDHLNRWHRRMPDVAWTINLTWARARFIEYFNGATFHDPTEFK